jgi:hypothetical protein
MVTDDERVLRFLPHLTDALWRFREDPNWATQGALLIACGALWGDEWAQTECATNPAWAPLPGDES